MMRIQFRFDPWTQPEDILHDIDNTKVGYAEHYSISGIDNWDVFSL